VIDKRKTKTKGTVYEVRLRDGEGREYSKTFETFRAAKDFEASERADRRRGVWVDPRHSRVTFSEWAATWLDSNPNKRKKTRATDEGMIRVHMNPTLGNRRLDTIKPLDIQRLVASWTTARKPGSDKPYKPSSIHRQYAVLRAIFAAAVEAELLGRTPCRGVNLPRVDPVRRHPLSRPEIAALSDALGDDYATMMYVGAALGLRWGECAALRVGRIDFLNATVTVAEGLGDARGEIYFDSPKSAASNRTLSVPKPLMDMLSAQLARRGLTAADPDALVFVSPKGHPLRFSNWRRRVWLPALEAAGLSEVGPDLVRLGSHDLRRANATAMLTEGVDPITAMKRMGQSDLKMLALYAQSTDESERDAADRIGSYFLGSDDTDDAAEAASS